MNWALFALSISAVLTAIWIVVLIKSQRSLMSIYVSFAFLLLAAMNSAAPIRGYVDPNYVGYGFGLLHATKGLAVTLMAGGVFLISVVSAFLAARNRPDPEMWIVAVACAAFAVIQGWPWLESVLHDPAGNKIQFGEYLTVPGVVASALLGVLLVLPFVLGAPWAARRALVRKGFFFAVLFFPIATSPLSAQILTSIEEAEKKKVLEQEEAKPRLTISGWIESGITFNPASPEDNQNFGRLFDDRSNEFVMNQAVITAERALDAKIGFDWGFKLQLMFGTDARYIHSLGLRDRMAERGLYQADIPEVYLSLHLPVLTEGGIDVKLGKFVTLEGVETIDPRTNAFYSHTYIFNFGIPFNHTGALFTLHAKKWLDLIAGVTRGVNTSIDDNNDSPAFHGGVGLNFNEGKIAVLASTHIGPETINNDSALRYLNDVAITWKITGKLTSSTDINYAHDDGVDADAYGVAQYLTYVINDRFTAKIRGEIWRDDDGFYVAQFANPGDPMRALNGQPTIDPRTVGGGPTTYGALTVGLDIKPPVPKPFSGLTIRPELRVDHSFSDTTPFNDSSDDTMFTAAIDFIIGF
jgi:hypothetical protein